MPEWLQQLLTSAAVTGASIWVIQKYLLAKIKHDFDLKLERIKPLTAEDTLRRQNYLNSKRDAYFEATQILCRHMEAAEWNGPDVPADRIVGDVKPTESEINGCLAKLALYSDDPQIAQEFMNCFLTVSPASLGIFLNRLRMDLGYDKLPTNPEEYGYVFARSNNAAAAQQSNTADSAPPHG